MVEEQNDYGIVPDHFESEEERDQFFKKRWEQAEREREELRRERHREGERKTLLGFFLLIVGILILIPTTSSPDTVVRVFGGILGGGGIMMGIGLMYEA